MGRQIMQLWSRLLAADSDTIERLGRRFDGTVDSSGPPAGPKAGGEAARRRRSRRPLMS